jgi:hypothetical protein
MSPTASWTCPACREPVATPFCARCGEEPLAARELTLRGLADKLLHALTNIDARALRTLRRLLRFPGELTVAWTSGVRRPYVAPFQLFLIANVLFFGVQSITGEIVLSSPLDSHLHHQDWSELAQSLVAEQLALEPTEFGDYARSFDRAVALHAKSFVVLMTVPFALLLPLVFVRRRRPFMAHVVFSLHFYAFLLLLFCIDLLAARASALLGHGGLESAHVDNVLTLVNLLACTGYLFLAIGPVYGVSGGARIAHAVVLSIAVGAIVVGYRFVLFLITLHSL